MIRPADDDTVHAVNFAIELMRIARNCLAAADCPQAVKKVRRAIRSAEGARRHARHRRSRTEEAS